MKIGIGIITRNRNDIVKQCIDNILLFLAYPKKTTIIVIDDASIIPVVDDRVIIKRFNIQSGIAKGKNECLRLLKGSDHFFLFDDDCWPVKKGWEDLYIDNAKFFNYKALCFTWDTLKNGKPSDFFKIIDKISDIQILDYPIQDCYYVEKKLIIINDKRHIIENETNLIIEIANFKKELGLTRGQAYTIETLIVPMYEHGIKIHQHGCGVMIYLHKDCIKKIGGFYEKFGIYGGDHVDYFIRLFNTGLIDGLYPDTIKSDQYLEALDRNESHESVMSKDEIDALMINVMRLMEQRKNSTEKVKI